MKKKVFIVAAHPDDEVLGCGATIAKHVKNGDDVHVAILAEGITSRDRMRNSRKRSSELSALSKMAHSANKILGTKLLLLHNFPDNRMDSLELLEVVKVIEGFVDRFLPDIVYTHHAGDLNVDHRIVHQAVVTALRPLPASTVRTLLFFEVASSTEWHIPGSADWFMPNWFVDVSSTIDLKLEALKAYASEMQPWPHARSIEAVLHLARWRGATVGAECAEAFVTGRVIL